MPVALCRIFMDENGTKHFQYLGEDGWEYGPKAGSGTVPEGTRSFDYTKDREVIVGTIREAKESPAPWSPCTYLSVEWPRMWEGRGKDS